MYDWRSRSFKVIDFRCNRKPTYDFLLVINCHVSAVSNRFWDIARELDRKPPHPVEAPVKGTLFEFRLNGLYNLSYSCRLALVKRVSNLTWLKAWPATVAAIYSGGHSPWPQLWLTQTLTIIVFAGGDCWCIQWRAWWKHFDSDCRPITAVR